ncbi:Type II secretion pathway protein D homolog [hydrothermal vent metagenome]|uniref:Type II secretion pathway protein D homolog n=1 Tax=hydrothermal vent metagenome TaxID=652676 RepID=A0A3B0X9H6_9ZZZZ
MRYCLLKINKLMTKKFIKNRILFAGFAVATAMFVAACGATNPPTPSEGHIKSTSDSDAADKALIPQPISQVPALPRPGKREKLETYTVVVNQVPVRELLFSMARDADLNLDIDSDISGKITMNAIDQTLLKILERMESQADIRYTLEDGTLKVKADKPYLHTYNVNYLNISRESKGKVSVSTEIGATASAIRNSGGGRGSGGSGSGGSGRGGSGQNRANSDIKNESSNDFWKTITSNIGGILGQGTKNSAALSTTTNSNIIVNRESGIIAVRATSKQHKSIKNFIDRVVGSAHRQVLIEVTIAEVQLSDTYQAGVDWSVINETSGGTLTKGGVQDVIGGSLGSSPFFQLAGTGTINGNPLNMTLKALETFGNVKVLSSPKVMTLNNQMAILKVVDNEVYFTTDVQLGAGAVNQNSQLAVDTTVNTIPVGIVMSVTPYIDETDTVTLNIRPTISRIIRFVDDPNPLLAREGVVSQIPVLQVREIETMLKVNNGETAVIGGLMQDQINKENRGVPLLSSIPLLGALFSYTEEEFVKSELVVFIRPVVIEHASLDGDLSDYKKYLLENIRQETSDKLDD